MSKGGEVGGVREWKREWRKVGAAKKEEETHSDTSDEE